MNFSETTVHSVETVKQDLNEDKNFQDLLDACRSGDLERVERSTFIYVESLLNKFLS